MDQNKPAFTNRARTATMLIFLVCGIGVSAWAPMVPLVKEKLHLNERDLGVLLLFFGGGAIVTMPAVGMLINKVGSKLIILVAGTAIAFALPLLTFIPTTWGMALVLFIFGAAVGSLDVAMNAHAVVVQDLMKKPIMSSFHGMFSVGGLLGSVGFGWLMLPGLSALAAASFISLLLLMIIIRCYNRLLVKTTGEKEPSARFRFPTATVLLLGSFCFIFFLTEGAMLDWSAVFLKEYRAFDTSMTGTGYAVFSIAMAIMRLRGDKLVYQYGAAKIVLWGSIVAASGILLAVTVPGAIAALAGFMLIGFGAANVVPILFSAAGRSKSMGPGAALATATTMGYAGQLAGPALIGFCAQFTSLPIAIGILACPLLLTGITFVKGGFAEKDL